MTTWWPAAVVAAVVLVLTMLGQADDPADSDDQAETPGASATPSDEPATATVPDLEDRSRRAARRALEKRGLVIEVVERRPSAQPAGSILRQSVRPGKDVALGSTIEVVVAVPLPRVVGVVGSQARAAAARLRRAGFRVERTLRTVTSGTGGVVLEQRPAAGQPARPGAVVRLVVARLVPTVAASACTPGYSPCLPPASDYDCAGGSGNGPKYTTVVAITGSDPYDLDADGDGYGCE